VLQSPGEKSGAGGTSKVLNDSRVWDRSGNRRWLWRKPS